MGRNCTRLRRSGATYIRPPPFPKSRYCRQSPFALCNVPVGYARGNSEELSDLFAYAGDLYAIGKGIGPLLCIWRSHGLNTWMLTYLDQPRERGC